jgi:hypothetical protein
VVGLPILPFLVLRTRDPLGLHREQLPHRLEAELVYPLMQAPPGRHHAEHDRHQHLGKAPG